MHAPEPMYDSQIISRHVCRLQLLKSKFCIEWNEPRTAHQVERPVFPGKHVLDERAGHPLALPGRDDRQGSQLTRAIMVRLDLHTANYVSAFIYRDDKPPPIQPGWVNSGLPDDTLDFSRILLSSLPQGDHPVRYAFQGRAVGDGVGVSVAFKSSVLVGGNWPSGVAVGVGVCAPSRV